jgi:uncharacterized protein DUF4054
MTTGIAITWNDILMVARDEADDLSKLDLFSLDIIARIDVADAPSMTEYEINIDGDLYSYEREVDQTTEAATQGIINMINSNRTLFYKVSAVIGDFNDQLLICSKKCFDPIPVTVGVYLSIAAGSPLAIGGRSFILEETALKCKESVYKDHWKKAQAYYAAHIAVQAKLPATGLGSLSSESFPEGQVSYLIPTLNPKADEEILMTTYGRRYNSIKKSRIVKFRVFG